METYLYDPFKGGVVKPERIDLDQFSAAYETAMLYLHTFSEDECTEGYQNVASIMRNYAMDNGFHRLYGRLPSILTKHLFDPQLYPTPPTFHAQLWRHRDTWKTIDDAELLVNYILRTEYPKMEEFLGDLSTSRDKAICMVLALFIKEAHRGSYVTGTKTALTALLHAAIPVRSKSRKAEDVDDRNRRIGIYAKKLLEAGTPPHKLTSMIADRFRISPRQAYNVQVKLGIKRK